MDPSLLSDLQQVSIKAVISNGEVCTWSIDSEPGGKLIFNTNLRTLNYAAQYRHSNILFIMLFRQ